MDIIKLLKKDHDDVLAMFRLFEQRTDGTPRERETLANRILGALETHSQVEETHFYAALEKRAETRERIKQNYQEHAAAKALINELRGLTPRDATYNTKMKTLHDAIGKHAVEEETRLFPQARKVLGNEALLEAGERAAELRQRLAGEGPEAPPPV